MVSIITHAAITQGPDLDPLLEPSNSCSFMNPDSRTFGYVHLEHGRHTHTDFTPISPNPLSSLFWYLPSYSNYRGLIVVGLAHCQNTNILD